jgi:hypothetical protein
VHPGFAASGFGGPRPGVGGVVPHPVMAPHPVMPAPRPLPHR